MVLNKFTLNLACKISLFDLDLSDQEKEIQ